MYFIGLIMFCLLLCGCKEKAPSESPNTTAVETTTESLTEEITADDTTSSSSEEGIESTSFDGYYLRGDSGDGSTYVFHVRENMGSYEAVFFEKYSGDMNYVRSLRYLGTFTDSDTIVFDSGYEQYIVNVDSDGIVNLEKGDNEYEGPFCGKYKKVDVDEVFDLSFEVPDFPPVVLDNNCEVEMDASLAKAIRSYNNLSEDTYLTKEYLESMYDLRIFEDEITSLKGVSALKDLHVLMISKSFVSDISEVAELLNLECLDISWSYIKEIPDFSNLTNLKEIRLAMNLIEDISPINKIPNIEYVDLSSNRIKYLEPIADNNSIISLGIDSNCILDFEKLKGKTSIIDAISSNGLSKYEDFLEVEKRAKEIVANITDDSMTDLQKEIAIHRYIIENTEYVEAEYSKTAYGYRAIILHEGVCGNYAEGFALLACHAGLDAGTICTDNHEFNYVKINGKYYICDSLWDEGNEIWNFFNRSTGEILKEGSHVYDVLRYPNCMEEMDMLEYYDDMISYFNSV